MGQTIVLNGEEDEPRGAYDEPVSSPDDEPELALRLRRRVLIIAALNFGYFFVELSVALAIGSVSLFADSVDFLEDTAINLLIFIALGWPLARRSVTGKLMALLIVVPALAATWEAIAKLDDPQPPAFWPLTLASLGAIVINGASAWLLLGVRSGGGSLSRAAFVSARNDVLVNLAIIAMAAVTLRTRSGWPDLVLGIGIIALALHSAYEVWEVAEEERLAAKALAVEKID